MIKTIEINFYDTELSVDYEYDPGEPMVMYHSDLSGSPGEPPSVNIQDIFVGETSVFNIFDSDLLDSLQSTILETYE